MCVRARYINIIHYMPKIYFKYTKHLEANERILTILNNFEFHDLRVNVGFFPIQGYDFRLCCLLLDCV